jgi:Ser/Thr protein kinase RdoA (MazF antagonist)
MPFLAEPLLADSSLLRREKVLDLSLLFDNDAVAGLLRRHFPDLDIQSARGHYVRYKPLVSCLVRYDVTTYDVTAGERSESFYIKQSLSSNKPAKAEETKKLEQHRVILEQQGLVLHRFPDDLKLKRLKLFADPQKQRKLQRKLLPHVSEATFETLTYKPERRLALKAVNAHDKAVLKFYTPETFAEARCKAERMTTQDIIHAPRLLGSSERYGVMVLEWLDGTLLRDLLMTPHCDVAQVQQVGAALAQLHRQTWALPARSPNANRVRAETLVDYMSWLLPELSGRLHDLLKTLTLPAERFVTLHGDFYSKQVLVHDARVAFLDVDEAHCGDPAFDLGLFLAHLEADGVRGMIAPAVLEEARQNFLHGYEREMNTLPKHLTSYTVMGILTLLPHFFRNRLPDWAQRTEQLLTRAEILLSEQQHHAVTL